MGITWTHLESVWNPLQTSNWSETIIYRFLQQTGSSSSFLEGDPNIVNFLAVVSEVFQKEISITAKKEKYNLLESVKMKHSSVWSLSFTSIV